MDFKEILVSAALPMVKAVGKAELSELLETIQKNNTPEMYGNTLTAVYSSFSLLHEVAVKTKTKIDDGLIDFVLETVVEKAQEAGINLTTTTVG